MKFTHAMLFGLALIVGVAIGYMFNPSVEEPAAPKHEQVKGAAQDAGDAASLAALRARIAELEALLAKRGGETAEETKPAAEARGAARRDERGPGGMSPKEWREKMKKENPERYAQMTNGFARMRRDRQARAQQKADFLASLDVSGMSASAQKTHTELQELMAKREQLEQKMHALHESEADVSQEEMGQFFREMHETSERIRELNAEERDNLMVETARNLGFSEDEATEVAEIFQEIVDNTQDGRGGRGGPGGPGGPGGSGNSGGAAPPPPPGM